MVSSNTPQKNYVAFTGAEVRSIQKSRQVRYASNAVKPWARPVPKLNAVPCGQSLAGSGALVFEGELLEISR